MGLFAQEPGTQAPQTRVQRYTGWTREIGTRNLILWFAAIVTFWYVFGRVEDHFLLQAKWPQINARPEGLTVIGTLDSRDYDRNLFRVITANQISHVELTEFGYNSIFDEKNGPLFLPTVGDTIHAVQGIDSDTGYKMLEPYLRAGVASALGKTDWTTLVSRNCPITVLGDGKNVPSHNTTLGALIDKYSKDGVHKEAPEENSAPEVGSQSDKSVEHGTAIPPDSLIAIGPVVLNEQSFTSAEVEDHPATAFDTATYTATLHLTSEGRSRFFQWSSRHAGENLIFVLQHEVVAAGRIKDQMDVSSWQIGPLHDQQSAKSLVDYINKLKSN